MPIAADDEIDFSVYSAGENDFIIRIVGNASCHIRSSRHNQRVRP